ncbi:hypothetical protein OESDEN_18582, partial [Oesophagostomum dentatum]
VNRKNFHSINVGLVCDDRLTFRWVSASFPGSAHDSRVFKESQLYNDFVAGRKVGCLIGDSAYAAERFLIKVIENPSTREENRYNAAVCAARSHIERAIGCLKSQWKILREECRQNIGLGKHIGRRRNSKTITYSYHPDVATKIIVACVVLRNIAILANETMEELEEDRAEEPQDDDVLVDEQEIGGSVAGRALIRRIISEHFHVRRLYDWILCHIFV